MSLQKRKKSSVDPAPPVSISSSVSSSAYEPILTKEQAAEILQVAPSTIYDWTKRHVHPLPCDKAGKLLRFRRSEIEQWLRESREVA